MCRWKMSWTVPTWSYRFDRSRVQWPRSKWRGALRGDICPQAGQVHIGNVLDVRSWTRVSIVVIDNVPALINKSPIKPSACRWLGGKRRAHEYLSIVLDNGICSNDDNTIQDDKRMGRGNTRIITVSYIYVQQSIIGHRMRWGYQTVLRTACPSPAQARRRLSHLSLLFPPVFPPNVRSTSYLYGSRSCSFSSPTTRQYAPLHDVGRGANRRSARLGCL